jgi:hypothetical protein
MADRELRNLREKRRYLHRQLDRWEPLLARLRANLAETEAAIQAIAPGLKLPPRRYAPNPYFARGELPRLILQMLREADEPLSVRAIAVRALALKSVTPPDRQAMKLTRKRVQQAFARFAKRGVVRSVGHGREGKRELVR